MNTVEFTSAVTLVSISAGFLGSLTGLGGGVVIVPVLTLLFGVDIRYAIGASLVSVIATSSGSAAAYVREGYSNIRAGMFLEVATTAGALGGAFLAAKLPLPVIGAIFGLVLLYSAYLSIRQSEKGQSQATPHDSGKIAKFLSLDGTYPFEGGFKSYHVYKVPLGFGLMGIAGLLSGLLGIGSGALKVIAMDQVMGLPFKVSTTTSNFMIGVTAAASAGVYLSRGYIDPGLSMPVMLGVLAGSLAGARLVAGTAVRKLRMVFSIVIVAMAVEMIYSSITGKL
jgi:uncharacterized protein